jgi:hypothetical protein
VPVVVRDLARVGPTTPTRARKLADASVDPTDARNAKVKVVISAISVAAPQQHNPGTEPQLLSPVDPRLAHLRDGFSPPRRGAVASFPPLARQVLVRRGLARSEAHTEQLGPHVWWLPRLAEAIPVIVGKLANWERRGADRGGRPSNISGFPGPTSRS